MKICKIYIKGFQQFQDVKLDFTNPETGEPLDKVCFIGSNGTGKSTLLTVIKFLVGVVMTNIHLSINPTHNRYNFPGKVLFQVTYNNKVYFIFCFNTRVILFRSITQIVSNEELVEKIFGESQTEFNEIYWREFTQGTLNDVFINEFKFKGNGKDLLIFSPAESANNSYSSIEDVPKTTVNEALELSKNFPFYAEVSSGTVNTFWKLLLYNLRKRAEERDAYENQPENLVKVKQQLIEEFDGISPKILEYLNIVWEKILSKAGLYFDVKGANNPFQLNDNLKAYIKLKGQDTVIPYSELSTGIRNFIFRIGHIFSLYFNREIDRGFLLLDEPENSLFPDFLFDLVEIYQQIIIDKRGQNNTQMFFATHNPIIAAQFKPYERIILDWNDDGTVNAKKGITPEGDDPNDILEQDFEVRELMSSKGVEVWKRYLLMKDDLKKAETKEEKFKLASEINKIGLAYNFPG